VLLAADGELLGEAMLTAVAGPPGDNYTRAVGATAREEDVLVARLQAGDETAFRELVTEHHRAMRRLALSYVQTVAAADEVVQETWLAVIRGLAKFEGRSSLKTWIFRILVNRAQTRGARERRIIPFSALVSDADDDGPTVDPDRFLPKGHPVAGYWSVTPNRFFDLPEERLLAQEATAAIAEAIARLPDRQRRVIELRDVEGWEAEEVCASLELSAANQRVLLHRARSAVRASLEEYFAAQEVET
jgi:RNA polymerase sigma-70 factor, ECF subfamily